MGIIVQYDVHQIMLAQTLDYLLSDHPSQGKLVSVHAARGVQHNEQVPRVGRAIHKPVGNEDVRNSQTYLLSWGILWGQRIESS